MVINRYYVNRLRVTEKLMERWNSLWGESTKNNIKLLLDNSDFIFFFKCDGKIFGTGEQGRLIFAKMKDTEDADNTEAWRKEASFTASDLTELLAGKQNQHVFGEKEIEDIEVLDKDEVEKLLAK